MTTKNESTRLIDPALSCVKLLGDSLIVHTLLERGVFAIQELPTILALTEKSFRKMPKDTKLAFKRLQKTAAADAAIAKDVLPEGLPRFRLQLCVAMWSAVETTIEDTIIIHLKIMPHSFEVVEEKYPKMAKRRPRDDASDLDFSIYFRQWERAVGDQHSDVVDRAMAMLSMFGLNFSLPGATHRNITELAEARNIILHNRSIIDERFLQKVPHTTFAHGEEYGVSADKVLNFHQACSDFTVSLMRQILHSPVTRAAGTS